MKICIDPGHGGKDPGATNGSVYEKNINLAVALKLKKLLIERGLEVLLTRETDVYNTVNEKAKMANTYGADLFVSIHCNSATVAQANGTETLVYSLEGESFRLGNIIQDKLIEHLKRANRGVKARKDLAVLNSTKMPAVLVELAFISNDAEMRLLINDKFQEAAAQAICEGILSYAGLEDGEMVEKRYNTIEEIPDWGKPTIQKLINKGCFADINKLNLTEDMIRGWIINDRYGLYNK